MSDLFSSLKISGSGLSVFRKKMNVAAENLANAETTKTKEGGPYKKKVLRISAKPVQEHFSGELKGASIKLAATNNNHLPGNNVTITRGQEVDHAEGDEYIDPQQTPRMIYDPTHPDANAEGFVAMPDVDPLSEMVEMMIASRGYEANLSAIQAVKAMTNKALEI